MEAPAQTAAGLVTIVVKNQDSEPIRGFGIGRLLEGKTFADVQAAVPRGEDAVLTLVEPHGGLIGGMPMGGRQRFVVSLQPGSYALSADVAKGQLAPLQVVAASGAGTPERRADITVTLKDFAFTMPKQVRAGTQTWKVTNQGPSPHMLVYARLLPGKTLKDVLAAGPNERPPLDFDSAGGVPTDQPGQSEWIPMDLQPGNYAVLCFVFEPSSGKSHVELGMAAEFTVAGDQPPQLPSTGEAPAPAALPDTGAGASWLVLTAIACFLLALGTALQRRLSR
jgi:hypothetical protein